MIIIPSDEVLFRNMVYLRKKYLLSQRALAKLIGMSVYHLRTIENGTAAPLIQSSELKRLCAVFDVTAENLIHRDLSAL